MNDPLPPGGDGRFPAGTPRLADIAGRASVSEATVSRVLNGRPGVADTTRQRVLAALDTLGHERGERDVRELRDVRQERSARGPKQRGAGLIGLVTPELTNPVFPAFAQAVEQVLAGHGHTPVLCTQLPGGATEDELVEQLVERGVGGIVFLSGLHADTSADPARYAALAARGVPYVLINGYNERVSAPFVSADDHAAVRMAVGHLAELGHRRIGLATGPQRYVPSRRKREGFLDASVGLLGLAWGEAEELVCSTLFGVEGGQVAADALLGLGCTGIVCASDLMALGVVRAARERGLGVPHDISVVGYDDSQLIAFTDPPLTTVRQPVRAMAAAAVAALLEEMAGSPMQRTEYVFQPELVVRGSTAGARVPRRH
ncbi:LacI family transcriptional regulator [Streptomyces scopuliridis]|uniref:LacI family transcriptional regulator n=1 Tax=Streptomyces scopuliridis TaxID=452529 RepID=A0ACD4ZPX1_9ACTN|nr:LacI family DNA-binding transcriptional regulator [Streptomyces scopuliridis]WSB36154.1 LacI family transcriptional regulator [Streptomyces scopuliridis]WSC00449.1 LacI family transcriptional regulator [Streptomyces scopuliridis]WSC05939.1 LacI family transcriptional regulator [Streptomyces scopuliridis]